MGKRPFDKLVDQRNKGPSEQFESDRLDRDDLTKSEWPSQVDRAALDLLHGVALGQTAKKSDIGGAIDRDTFPEATGEFYVEGLRALAGSESDLGRAIGQYDDAAIGELALHLSEFREELRSLGGEEMDVDRAVEALVEKAATEALERSSGGENSSGGLRQLRNSNSTADVVTKLFSDPQVEAYADALIDIVTGTEAGRTGLLTRLDEPRMTTPLWNHQREALQNWTENGQSGYVDMATATGKTVLGLAAIASRYGALHPADSDAIPASQPTSSNPRVLVVAGNTLLLSQWRDELDEHLDIPPARTVPADGDRGKNIELGWGTIEFRTTQALLNSSVTGYDLVILDEAHQYSRSGSGSWRDLFERLTTESNAILALSGSVDGGWQGDDAAKRALSEHLEQCHTFTVPEARDRGVIADFSWEVHYAPATANDEANLAEQTQLITDAFDSRTGELDADALNVDEDAVEQTYDTYKDLRTFVRRNAGNKLRGESNAFDRFASAVLARQTYNWQAAPNDDALVDLVVRHAPPQKTVVIVDEYAGSVRLRDRLVEDEGFDAESVVALENAEDDRSGKIERFNGLDGGVLIGPGDLIGTGVNMPDAEVAINVGRAGVNTSLVQRIGRVLRNPSGDKEAMFYDVVAQPTDTEAIDFGEDGHRFLRRAAEYRALGESFEERPKFAVHTDDLAEIDVKLERTGEQLLERLGDERAASLPETESAVDALHELRDAVRARDETDHTEPAVVDYWSPEEESVTESAPESEWPFTQRDDRYERYRLRLDQYRAAKAAAETLLDANPDVHRENGAYTVTLSNEYAGTTFHKHLERRIDEFQDLARELEGVRGSLSTYREQWPEPRDEDGARVSAEAAATLGIDYGQENPLFFPQTDGEPYELPLPDGRVFTVDGLEERDRSEIPERSAESNVVHLSATLVTLGRAQADRDGTTFEELTDSWTRDLLESVIELDDPPFITTPESETMAVTLPAEVAKFVELSCETHPAFDDPSTLVETAVRAGLDVGPTSDEQIAVEVPALLKRAVEAEAVDVSEVVMTALRDALQ